MYRSGHLSCYEIMFRNWDSNMQMNAFFNLYSGWTKLLICRGPENSLIWWTKGSWSCVIALLLVSVSTVIFSPPMYFLDYYFYRYCYLTLVLIYTFFRYWCMSWTVMEPSPTVAATLFIDLRRTSPRAKIPLSTTF